MAGTPNLNLPYIASGQAQKHVTYNEAIQKLDAIVQISVQTRDVDEVLQAIEIGTRFIISATPTGDFSDHAYEVVQWEDDGWHFFEPDNGWLAWVEDEKKLYVYQEAEKWTELSSAGSINQLEQFGVNATPDETNRLSVSSDASLFSHNGSDHRLVLNKASQSDTASIIFQSNYSGRAEMGLAGEDVFYFKTSADGGQWVSRLILPQTERGILTPSLRSGEIQIGADEVGVIATPSASGFFFFYIHDDDFPQITHAGIYLFDSGASPNLVKVYGGSSVEMKGVVDLNVTIGDDNKTNISVQTGTLQIQNRFYTNNRVYRYGFIA